MPRHSSNSTDYTFHTYVGCTQCSADPPRSDGSDPRQSGLGILDGPPTSLEPPSIQGGRDFTKQPSSICHFATSKNLVQDVMFRHLGFVRKREKKATPTPEIPAGFCQFAQKTFCQSAVLSLSLLELSPYYNIERPYCSSVELPYSLSLPGNGHSP